MPLFNLSPAKREQSWTPEEFFSEARQEPVAEQAWTPEEFFSEEPQGLQTPVGSTAMEIPNALMRGGVNLLADMHAGRFDTAAQNRADLDKNSWVTPDIAPKDNSEAEQLRFSRDLHRAASVDQRLEQQGITDESINREIADAAQTVATLNATSKLMPVSEDVTAFKEGDSWGKTLATNPIEVPLSLMAESASQFLPVLAAAAVNPALAIPASGATTFVSESLSSKRNSYNQASGDPYNPHALAKAVTPENSDAFETKANTRGAITGLGSLLSAGLGGKFISAAGGRVTAGAAGKELATQLLVDGGAESAAQLATEGKIDPRDLTAEMVGGLPTSAVEVAAGAKNSIQDRAAFGDLNPNSIPEANLPKLEEIAKNKERAILGKGQAPGKTYSPAVIDATKQALADQKATGIDNALSEITRQQATGATQWLNKKPSRGTAKPNDLTVPLTPEQKSQPAKDTAKEDAALMKANLKKSGLDISKMGMNSFFDPSQVAGMARVAARKGKGAASAVVKAADDFTNTLGTMMIQGTEKLGLKSPEVQAWRNSLADSAQLLRPHGSGKRNSAARIAASALLSTNTRLVRLATKLSDPSAQALGKVVKKLHTQAGDTGQKVGLHDNITRERTSRINNLMRSVKYYIETKPGRGLKEAGEELEAVGSALANNTPPTGPEMANAVHSFKEHFRSLRNYAHKAGLEFGDVGENYFPRVFDHSKILTNPAQSMQDFAQVYKIAGEADPVEKARKLFDAVVMADSGLRIKDSGSLFTKSDQMPSAERFTKNRVLPPEADKILDAYYERNALAVAETYTSRIVQAAEHRRAFGENYQELNELMDTMVKSGDLEMVDEVAGLLKSQLGMLAKPLGTGPADALINAAQTAGPLLFLHRTALSAVYEPTIAAVRTGKMIDIAPAFYKTLRALGGMAFKTGDYKTRRALAEDLGIVSNALDTFANISKYIEPDALNASGKKIVQMFHLKTGLTALTDATRMMAIEMGQMQIRRLALEPAGDVRDFFLSEIGIEGDQIPLIQKFVNDMEGMSLVDSAKAIKSNTPAAQAYRDAITIFTHQVVMEPSRATRPKYANHPRYALAYQLSSFSHTFNENVLRRQWRLLKKGAAEAGLTPSQRLAYMRPALMAPVQILVGTMVFALRSAYKGEDDKEKEPWQKIAAGASMAGMYGRYDTMVNYVGAMRYKRSPFQAAAGPTLGKLADGLASVYALARDLGSNSAQRNATQDMYELLAIPAMSALASTATPHTKLGLLIGGGVIQATSHPRTSDKVTDLVAGKESKRGSSSSRRGKGSRRKVSRSKLR